MKQSIGDNKNERIEKEIAKMKSKSQFKKIDFQKKVSAEKQLFFRESKLNPKFAFDKD